MEERQSWWQDPFYRRLLSAAAIAAAGVGLAPIISDVGLRPSDGPWTLLWLAISLFGVAYVAIVAVAFLLALLPPVPRLHRPGRGSAAGSAGAGPGDEAQRLTAAGEL